MTVPYVFAASTGGGATANDIINRAGRRAKILAASEAWAADDAVDILQMMNDMMHGFGPRGIHYAHTTLTATQTVNMPDEQIRNLVLLLAGELLIDYGMEATPALASQITAAEQQLQAAYYTVPEAKISRSVLPTRYGWFDITRGQ